MKKAHLRFKPGFHVVFGNSRAQAAEMVIPPGGSEGGPSNNHRGADQWLFITAGRGIATVQGKRSSLRKGTLLLIERGKNHEIRNTGTTPLKTLNIYLPPAYTDDGEERVSAKPKRG